MKNSMILTRRKENKGIAKENKRTLCLPQHLNTSQTAKFRSQKFTAEKHDRQKIRLLFQRNAQATITKYTKNMHAENDLWSSVM